MGPQRLPAHAPAALKTASNKKFLWCAGGLLALAVAIAAVIAGRGRPKAAPGPLDFYQRDVAVVQAEYRKFHGRLLRDPGVEYQFRIASDFVARKNYPAAIDALESVAKEAAVPAIFNNLGSLYAASGDRARAILAFREALARDAEYRPVRDSIDRLKWVGPDEANPLRREVEPNNSAVNANLIGIGAPVEGEIVAGDTDTFRFVTPAAPRDIVELRIDNLGTLEIGLQVSEDTAKGESARLAAAPGESVTRYLSRPPNTPVFLQLWGAHETAGPYRITLRAMKAFDAFEPNDDIFSAQRIEPGQKIDANIMDAGDTDFFVYQSPRTGPVTVEIENHSSTLIPALTVFTSDRRNSGFGPDVRMPGANLRHTFDTEARQTYYIQVWSQGATFGKYMLTIR